MPSMLTWLDFSEADRQQALQVIDLFREKDTLDELGFAPIRDAFADYFFPGTSTIQTRARYFLFVPWIVRRVARRQLPAAEFSRRLREDEARLIKALLAGDPNQYGIIGREAGATLKRMPSSVYWRGLHLWGIRRFAGSLDEYARRLVRGPRSREIVTDDGEPLGALAADWDPDLPPEPADLLARTTCDLTVDEAEFLRDRVLAAQPTSLLAQVLSRNSDPLETAHLWDAVGQLTVSNDLRDAVEHARCFSLCAWGASLLYTRMVATWKEQERKASTDLVAAVEGRLREWQAELSGDESTRCRWSQTDFWKLVHRVTPRVPPRTEQFARDWIAVALRAAGGEAVWDDPDVQKLVIQREQRLKGGRARLSPENVRARDRWRGDADIRRLDFRWGATRTVLNDILHGLNGTAEVREAVHA